MTETKSQMLEARAQFTALLQSAIPFLGLLLVLVLVLEIGFSTGVPYLTLGALTGCAYAMLNLWLLFSWLAPFFFFREKPIYVLYAVLISLSVGALLMFVAGFIGQRWALGLALGVASPAIIGSLHSLQNMATTSKSLGGKDIPLDLH